MDEDTKMLTYEILKLRVLLNIEKKKNEDFKKIVKNLENNYCELLVKYLAEK